MNLAIGKGSKGTTYDIQRQLKVYYQGTEIENAYFFNIRIANTGKKTVKDQTFTCEFTKNAKLNNPTVTTKSHSSVAMVPIDEDPNNGIDNKFLHTIKFFSPGQVVELEFFAINCKPEDFKFAFNPNSNEEVKFVSGDISEVPTLERNIRNTIINLVLFFVIIQIARIIPLLGYILGFMLALIGLATGVDFLAASVSGPISDLISNLFTLIGTVIALPFLVGAYRSFRPIIPIITRRLQKGLES